MTTQNGVTQQTQQEIDDLSQFWNGNIPSPDDGQRQAAMQTDAPPQAPMQPPMQTPAQPPYQPTPGYPQTPTGVPPTQPTWDVPSPSQVGQGQLDTQTPQQPEQIDPQTLQYQYEQAQEQLRQYQQREAQFDQQQQEIQRQQQQAQIQQVMQQANQFANQQYQAMVNRGVDQQTAFQQAQLLAQTALYGQVQQYQSQQRFDQAQKLAQQYGVGVNEIMSAQPDQMENYARNLQRQQQTEQELQRLRQAVMQRQQFDNGLGSQPQNRAQQVFGQAGDYNIPNSQLPQNWQNDIINWLNQAGARF